MTSRWSSKAGVLAVVALVSGCALNVTMQVVPQPGHIGEPLTYTVTITNPTSCTLIGTELVLAPLVERDASIDQLCSVAENPLPALCVGQDPADLPPDVVAACCAVPAFAAANPDRCSRTARAPSPPLAEEARSVSTRHAITSRALFPPSDPQAASTCVIAPPFVNCAVDDIPPGQSETVTVVIAASAVGSFANFAFAEGFLSCLPEGQVPFGSACVYTPIVGVAAPNLSRWGIAAAVLLLMATAAWRLRPPRRARRRHW